MSHKVWIIEAVTKALIVFVQR